MREIKFRAWDTNRKEMIRDHLSCGIELNSNFRSVFWIYEQYTGLKDKNGREIYEGDIVKAPAKSPDAICEVFWEMNCWMIKDAEGHTGLTNYGGKFAPEVIGNIHENADLLNA